MKRVIYLALLIFLCSFAYSLTISIDSPSEGARLSEEPVITMSITKDETETVTNVILYYTNGTESFSFEIGQKGTEPYEIDFDTTRYEDTATGYLSAKAIYDPGAAEATSTDVEISIDNTAPSYTDIPNMTWSEDTINTAYDINDYFSDISSLTYSVSVENGKVDVDIETDGTIKVTPAANYSGTEKVVITLPIGKYWSDEITHKWEMQACSINHDDPQVKIIDKEILIIDFLKIR